jgi:3-deoxy-7-phosphoheptulonate synthase
MIDASHANCGKKCTDMPETYRAILQQRAGGARQVIGAMLESNLVAGAQGLADKECLVYGQSITDQCIDWETTESLIRETAEKLG